MGLAQPFYLSSLILQSISLSVGYCIWVRLGTAGATLVGVFILSENILRLILFGLFMINVRIVLMNMEQEEAGEGGHTIVKSLNT